MQIIIAEVLQFKVRNLQLEEQIKEEAELNKKIVENLAKIKVGGTEK
jgi:hypothetical protein